MVPTGTYQYNNQRHVGFSQNKYLQSANSKMTGLKRDAVGILLIFSLSSFSCVFVMSVCVCV